jgi:PAT family beta-lactamase induction signal transducer AmpG
MNVRLAPWLTAAKVYTDRRVMVILLLGFSSGLPLALSFGTLSFWLAEEGISKATVGLFALAGLPYTLKFAWAPLIDRVSLPWLTPMLGRRRSWAILTQLALMVAIAGLGASDPTTNLPAVAIWTLLVTFSSASQDVVIDAYRVEILEERQYGAGSAMIVAGYRIGMLVSGAGTLYLAEAGGWSSAYLVMAALMVVGIVTILLNPEPAGSEISSVGDGDYLQRLSLWCQQAVVAPFADFMSRPYWKWILAFIVFYKFGDSLAGVMANPFYVDLGFSKNEVATISKGFGLAATLAGAFAGGMVVARYGIMSALLVCGVLQMLSNLMFAVQALIGYSVPMLMVTIAVENFTGGMGTAAFVAYLSMLCNIAHTATQYALLSSFMAFARTTLSAQAGYLVEAVDWFVFFALTTVAALPGLLLLWWLMRRGHGTEK